MDARALSGFSDIFLKAVTQLCANSRKIQANLKFKLQKKYANKLVADESSVFLLRHKSKVITAFVKKINGLLCQNALLTAQDLQNFISHYHELQNEASLQEELVDLIILFDQHDELELIKHRFYRCVDAEENIMKLQVAAFYSYVGVEEQMRADQDNIKSTIISSHENERLRQCFETFSKRNQYCAEKITVFNFQILLDILKLDQRIANELKVWKDPAWGDSSLLLAEIEKLQMFLNLEGQDFSTYKVKKEKELAQYLERKKIIGLEREEFILEFWLEILMSIWENCERTKLEKLAENSAILMQKKLLDRFNDVENESRQLYVDFDWVSMRRFIHFDRQFRDLKEFDCVEPENKKVFFIGRALFFVAGEHLKIAEKILFWEKFIRNRQDKDALFSNGNLRLAKDKWYKDGYNNPLSELSIDWLITELQQNLVEVEDLNDIEQIDNFIEGRVEKYLYNKLNLEMHEQNNHSNSDNYKKMLLQDWKKEMRFFVNGLVESFSLLIAAVNNAHLPHSKSHDQYQGMYHFYCNLIKDEFNEDCAKSSNSNSVYPEEISVPNSEIRAATPEHSTARPSVNAPGIWSRVITPVLKWVFAFVAVLFCCTADGEEVSNIKNESNKKSSRVSIYKKMGVTEPTLIEEKPESKEKEEIVIATDDNKKLFDDEQNQTNSPRHRGR